MRVCCFTNHRLFPKSQYENIQGLFDPEFEKLIQEEGVTDFKTDGVLELNRLVALSVIKFKRKYPHIKLILVPPCKEQIKGWLETDVKIYNAVLQNADQLIYDPKHYYMECMHKRTRCSVDGNAICLCYLTQPDGSAAHTPT